MLDVRTKAWKPLGPMPISRARHGMAACAGRLFLIGGSTTGACAAAGSSGTPERATASVHCYDVRAGRWTDTESAPLPRPLESLAAVAVGGQVHVLGGLCSGQSSGGGGSGSGSPRRPRVQSAAGVVASTLPRNLSERHHATAGVLLEEREMAAGLKQVRERCSTSRCVRCMFLSTACSDGWLRVETFTQGCAVLRLQPDSSVNAVGTASEGACSSQLAAEQFPLATYPGHPVSHSLKNGSCSLSQTCASPSFAEPVVNLRQQPSLRA